MTFMTVLKTNTYLKPLTYSVIPFNILPVPDATKFPWGIPHVNPERSLKLFLTIPLLLSLCQSITLCWLFIFLSRQSLLYSVKQTWKPSLFFTCNFHHYKAQLLTHSGLLYCCRTIKTWNFHKQNEPSKHEALEPSKRETFTSKMSHQNAKPFQAKRKHLSIKT